MIYREKGSASRNVMSNYFKQSDQKKTLTLTSNEAVKQAIMADLGCSIMPIVSVKNELANEQLYVVNRLDLPYSANWQLIWLKEKKFSPFAKAYLQFLEEEKDDIIKKHFNWLKELKNSH